MPASPADEVRCLVASVGRAHNGPEMKNLAAEPVSLTTPYEDQMSASGLAERDTLGVSLVVQVGQRSYGPAFRPNIASRALAFATLCGYTQLHLDVLERLACAGTALNGSVTYSKADTDNHHWLR